MPAGSQRPGGVKEIKQSAGVHHGAVRAEIHGAVFHYATRKEHPRIGLGSDANPGISLAVLEEDVVAGFVLLYQIVLEQQCVSFAVHHRILHVGNLADKQAGLCIQPFRGHKILRHPLMQVLGLAHINNRSLGVVIAVNSGGMR